MLRAIRCPMLFRLWGIIAWLWSQLEQCLSMIFRRSLNLSIIRPSYELLCETMPRYCRSHASVSVRDIRNMVRPSNDVPRCLPLKIRRRRRRVHSLSLQPIKEEAEYLENEDSLPRVPAFAIHRQGIPQSRVSFCDDLARPTSLVIPGNLHRTRASGMHDKPSHCDATCGKSYSNSAGARRVISLPNATFEGFVGFNRDIHRDRISDFGTRPIIDVGGAL